MKKVMKLIGNTVTVLLVVIVAMSVFSMLQHRKNPDKLPSVFGYSTMSVLTGSMRPYLQPGDMIVDRIVKAEEIKVGDVVTYKIGSSLVTHRVTEVLTEDSKILLMTRGDANNTDDGKPITEEQLIGKVVSRIPYGGYIARFIRSPIGLLLIIVIPVTFMLIGEVKNILSGGKKKTKEETDPKAV
ncbi:MAG TPA: signal peptidase I [Candidatus Nitrosocosmicus sp.]|nr:signal peptidase I [Candidatus Nitrosocosmicus sp.]